MKTKGKGEKILNQPIFKKVPLVTAKGKVSEQIKVSVKTDVSCETVKNVISVSCWADVYSVTVKDKNVEYKGKAVFFIAYEEENGDVKKCEKVCDFDGFIESALIEEHGRVSVFVCPVKTEADCTGLKLSALSNLKIDAEIFTKTEYECLECGDDIICDVKENTFYISSGVKELIYPLTEEFTLPYKVCEVLGQKAQAVITSVQCGVGAIIVDGEVYLSAILLQSPEKKDIIKENKVLPFRIEIECEEAMPSMRATCKIKVRALKTDVTVEEEKSNVSAVVTLKLEGEAFFERTFGLSKDAFSKTEKIEIKKDVLTALYSLDSRTESKNLSLKGVNEEILTEYEPIGAFSERVEIVSVEKAPEGLNVSGVLTASCLFRTPDNVIKNIKTEVPIQTLLEINEDAEDFDINAIVKTANPKITANGEFELTAEVVFTITPFGSQKVGYVKEIVSLGEKPIEDCALSVYIGVAGEDLFSLAKRLNESPEELLRANKDLTFPLTGEERIVIYRQK